MGHVLVPGYRTKPDNLCSIELDRRLRHSHAAHVCKRHRISNPGSPRAFRCPRVVMSIQQSNETCGLSTLSCLNSLRLHPGAVGNVLAVPRTSSGGSTDARGLHTLEPTSERELLLLPPQAPVPVARGGGMDRRLRVHRPSELMSVPGRSPPPLAGGGSIDGRLSPHLPDPVSERGPSLSQEPVPLAGGGSIEGRLCVQPSKFVPGKLVVRCASVCSAGASLFSTAETGRLRGTGSDAALPLQSKGVKAVAPGGVAALNVSLLTRALVCRVLNSTWRYIRQYPPVRWSCSVPNCAGRRREGAATWPDTPRFGSMSRCTKEGR